VRHPHFDCLRYQAENGRVSKPRAGNVPVWAQKGKTDTVRFEGGERSSSAAEYPEPSPKWGGVRFGSFAGNCVTA